MSYMDDLTRAANHHTLALYNARECDKVVAGLVERGNNVAEIGRWINVTRPTVYKMAERGRTALNEDQLPGAGT
jgi:hypothetical protein